MIGTILNIIFALIAIWLGFWLIVGVLWLISRPFEWLERWRFDREAKRWQKIRSEGGY